MGADAINVILNQNLFTLMEVQPNYPTFFSHINRFVFFAPVERRQTNIVANINFLRPGDLALLLPG